MKLRSIIFWLHLAAGVFAGIVVFIMSITGVALTYQKQMTEWGDRTYWPKPMPSGGERLSIEQLLTRTLEAQPEASPTAITFYSNPEAPALVAAAPGQNVFVNRYSGEVRVVGTTALRSFFRFATEWHRYVGAAGENRAVGKAITGACNLVFLFIVSSGVYLWWPRTWTVPSLRSVTWFKRGLSGKARDFNWHNVFGFWTAIPLFFVVLSATIISYPWASNLVYRLAGSPPPVRAQQRAGGTNAPAAPAVLDLNGIDKLLAKVEEQSPGWRTINVRLPNSADRQVTFAIDRSFGGQPQFRSTLVLDKTTGVVARIQTFADQTRGERARSWLRFVHTGEFYGVAGQTIAGVASAAGVMLVITGVSLTLRRFRTWIVGRRRTRTIIIAQGGANEIDSRERVRGA